MSKTVMVVDDSSAIRKFVMFALRARGLTVVTAQDGMDALEKMARSQVDLVITDLNMPKLDGFGLLRALRDDNDYAELPIIILSSLSSSEEQQQGLQLGANAYLVKPFDQRRIQYEVSKYI
ncbi:response regulator [Rhodocaloribacter sp.]|jgi:two-component system chemotaxis response regulator CheY